MRWNRMNTKREKLLCEHTSFPANNNNKAKKGECKCTCSSVCRKKKRKCIGGKVGEGLRLKKGTGHDSFIQDISNWLVYHSLVTFC